MNSRPPFLVRSVYKSSRLIDGNFLKLVPPSCLRQPQDHVSLLFLSRRLTSILFLILHRCPPPSFTRRVFPRSAFDRHCYESVLPQGDTFCSSLGRCSRLSNFLQSPHRNSPLLTSFERFYINKRIFRLRTPHHAPPEVHGLSSINTHSHLLGTGFFISQLLGA